MTQEELEQIEISNEEAKVAIKKGEAFKRLLANPDYQLFITQGYLDEYPKELGSALAKNTGAYDDDQLVLALKGTNQFIKYGFRVANAHQAAIQTITDNDAYIAEQEPEEE